MAEDKKAKSKNRGHSQRRPSYKDISQSGYVAILEKEEFIP
jgi:hypothetical protein